MASASPPTTPMSRPWARSDSRPFTRPAHLADETGLMQPPPPDDRPYLDPRRLRAIFTPALLAGGVFFLACLAFVLSGRIPTRAAYDQMHYHGPTVELFARQLPRLDFYDYYSATTPGYHVALAVVARIVPDSTQALQITSALIASVLIGLLAAACAGVFLRAQTANEGPDASAPRSRLLSSLLPAALALTLGCSMYVFQSGAWLLPDNAGWLLALCVCLLVLRAVSPHARAREGLILLAGLLVALVVFTRQSHAWTAGVVWLGGWLAATLAPASRATPQPEPFRLSGLLGAIFTSIPRRVAWAAAAAIATIPAVLTLLYFINLWHGLTPFRFQFQHQGKSPAALAMMLALVGLYSIFLAPIVLPLLARLWNTRDSITTPFANGRWAILLALAIALLASLIPNTTYSIDQGRWTGLWNLVRATPSIAGHTSPLLLALALVGSVSLIAWLSAWPTWPQRLVILAMLLGCTAAVAAGSELWPRYLESMALIIIALSAAHALAAHHPTRDPVFKFPLQSLNRLLSHAQRASIAVLCLFLLALTAQGTRSMQRLSDPPPPIKSEGDTGVVPLEIQVPPRGHRT